MILGFQYSFGYYPGFSQAALTTSTQTAYVSVKVYSLFYKQMVVEWNIPAFWGNCTFNVYRSEIEYGTYLLVNPTPLSSNYLKDTTTQDFSKFVKSFYIVEVILPTGQRIKSKPSNWENKRSSWVELRAVEITRRESLLLSKFTGVNSFIFRRKTFGKRCHRCWNSDIEKITEDHCPVCLGTSFEGGYFHGYQTLFQYEPTPNNTVLAEAGRVEPNTIPAWTINFPVINTLDLVLRVPDWSLYRVDQVSTTELQALQVRQIVQLTELDKESIEFELAKQAMPSNYRT